MKFALNGKNFRSVTNTENGEVTSETIFKYSQNGSIVTAEYSGGNIVTGHILATMAENGELHMRYHHLNHEGEFMLGQCVSTPVILSDGRMKYCENWQWLSGDMSTGYSEIEEITNS